MVLLIAAIVVIAVLLALWFFYEATGKPNGWCMVAIAAILLVGGGMSVPTYFQNMNMKAYLISTYEVNAGVYEIAADRTASYLSTDEFTSQLVAGSIEKQQLATVISQRVSEWRDVVAGYNQALATYRIWQDNPLVGMFWPSIPDDLKYLVIQ